MCLTQEVTSSSNLVNIYSHLLSGLWEIPSAEIKASVDMTYVKMLWIQNRNLLTWTNCTVKADLPTPPLPSTTILYSRIMNICCSCCYVVFLPLIQLKRLSSGGVLLPLLGSTGFRIVAIVSSWASPTAQSSPSKEINTHQTHLRDIGRISIQFLSSRLTMFHY